MSRRKTITLLSITGLVAYTGFLLATLPAAFIWNMIPVDQKRQLSISGLSGTIWSGSAQQVTIKRFPESIHLPAVAWQWQPSALFGGAIAADIHMGGLSADLEGKGNIAYGLGGVTINDLQVDTSAAWVAELLPQKLPGKLSGNLSLTARHLQIEQGHCTDLNGSIQLTGSQFNSPFGAIDLGNTQATLSCNPKALQANLKQSSPDVQSQANLTLAHNGHYTLNGTLAKGEAMDDKLAQGLNLLGQPDDNGRYPLDWRGRI